MITIKLTHIHQKASLQYSLYKAVVLAVAGYRRYW